MNGLDDVLVRDSQGCVSLKWGGGLAYSIEVLEKSKTSGASSLLGSGNFRRVSLSKGKSTEG